MPLDDIYEIYDSAERKWLVDNCDTVRAMMKKPEQSMSVVDVFNPRTWTKEMAYQWHKYIPDTQAAFEALGVAYEATKVEYAKETLESLNIKETCKENDQPVEFSLLGVLADIRQKTGVGDKVMLSELADTLAALIQNSDSAIDTNKRLVKKQLKRESDWQLIETAPKDGTKFLAIVSGFQPSVGWWTEKFGWMNDNWNEQLEIADGDEMYEPTIRGPWEPTHWMPIPPLTKPTSIEGQS